MALDNFIPEVWAARLLTNLNKNHVFSQEGVINRDYEGDINDVGDTVRINSIGRVTISNYSKNTDLSSPEALTDAQQTLLIDQAKYFNFQVDDVDKAQQKPKVMDDGMGEAAYALNDTLDSYLAGFYTDVATDNFVGTEASPKTGYTAADVYTYLVDLGTKLSEANVPSDGRWVIAPPFVQGYLLKDSRFVSAGTPKTDEVLRNGSIGMAAGFNIMLSNNVKFTTSTTKYKVLAGHKMAWSLAEQIRKVEAYRPEKRFADALKGLHLYGAKVTRPSALACLVINTT